MAKKKAVPEAAPASTQSNENGQTKSKIALGVELIAEWHAKGKDTRKSQQLLAELQSRHPDRDWKMADITNAKGKLRGKGSTASGNGRKKQQAAKEPKPTPKPAVPQVQQGGDVTATDLIAVKKAIGTTSVGSFADSVEQVGALAEQVGGFDKLRQAVQALAAILGTE